MLGGTHPSAEVIVRHCLGETSAAEQVWLTEHVQVCDGCRLDLESTQQSHATVFVETTTSAAPPFGKRQIVLASAAALLLTIGVATKHSIGPESDPETTIVSVGEINQDQEMISSVSFEGGLHNTDLPTITHTSKANTPAEKILTGS